MNKFKYYFIVSVALLSLFSCSKNDSIDTTQPPRDYSVQYTTDLAIIEDYLKTYSITITNHPGFTDDQDVVFTKIPSGGTQASIWSYLNNSGFPKLLSREVKEHDITYKLYYLVLREGVGEKPCNVDAVLTSYRGDYLSQTAATSTTAAALTSTLFEEIKYPKSFFNLNSVVVGWSEIFPQFRKGTYTANADGTISYNDFGAGVMFIPSGLGYYDSASGKIPFYSPLVFSFKLYEIDRLDQDADGILSYLEDVNGDGYIYDFRDKTRYPTTPASNVDDTDGDGIADVYDVDDDGDNYSTKLERSYIDNGLTKYYDFTNIPTCSSGKKRHLDASCH